MNHNAMIRGGANKFLLLTLTAVQASLQVTEDSSFNVFCNRGMQSIKEKRFPKKNQKKKKPMKHCNVTLKDKKTPLK